MVRIVGQLGILMMALTAPMAVAQARPGGSPRGATALTLQPVVRATEALELPMSTEPDDVGGAWQIPTSPPAALAANSRRR